MALQTKTKFTLWIMEKPDLDPQPDPKQPMLQRPPASGTLVCHLSPSKLRNLSMFCIFYKLSFVVSGAAPLSSSQPVLESPVTI